MAFSKSEAINDTIRQLIRRGWRPERGGKHWKVFSPEGNFRFIVPSTPSDFRAEKNWLADVRRKLKERDEDYSFMKTESFNNRPIVLPSQVTAPQPAKIVPVTFKKLSKKVQEDVDLCNKLRDEGKTYGDIADILNAMGYRIQGEERKLLIASNIGSFFYSMSGKKYRRDEPEPEPAREVPVYTPRPPFQPVQAAPTPEVKKEHPLLSMVLEIVSSNLNDDMKENVLQVMARDWMTKGKV